MMYAFSTSAVANYTIMHETVLLAVLFKGTVHQKIHFCLLVNACFSNVLRCKNKRMNERMKFGRTGFFFNGSNTD